MQQAKARPKKIQFDMKSTPDAKLLKQALKGHWAAKTDPEVTPEWRPQGQAWQWEKRYSLTDPQDQQTRNAELTSEEQKACKKRELKQGEE